VSGKSKRQPPQHAIATRVTYEGPLPPPAQLEQFERACPGSADRIIKMAESNSAHRQRLEAIVVEGNVDAQARGQWFALILALAVLGVGGWLVIAGRTSTGLWIMLGDITALAGIFIGTRLLQRRERAERHRALQAGRKDQ